MAIKIRTYFDDLVEAVEKTKALSLGKVATGMGVTESEAIERIHYLKGLLDLDYSINVLKKPTVILKKEVVENPIFFKELEGTAVDTYEFTTHKIPVDVEVLRIPEDEMNGYHLMPPDIGIGTMQALNKVITAMAVDASIDVEDITDPQSIINLKEKFQENAFQQVKKLLQLPDKQAGILSGIILHKIYGLDTLELLLGDDNLEEICVNSGNQPIIVYHRKHGWLKSNMYIRKDKNIFDFASQIGRVGGKTITNLAPLMDARLLTGDRVVASLFPVSSQGNTLTIRKFSRDPWTMVHFISEEYNTVSAEIAAFLWLAIQYELSILVAGGTASGKTSILNAISAFMPPGQRVVSIEDTRELQLPEPLHANWIQLTTRQENPEGLGGVDMLDLIISSLRMRPDRIIVGEIRARNEAEVLFEAMHTGHSVYSTMHADTCHNVKRRVTEPPISIPETELEALDLIVTQYRDRLHGIRRTFEVAEVMPVSEERGLELNYLYRWRVKTDTFERINTSKRIYNNLNLYTGLTAKEIEDDLNERQSILNWMMEQDYKNVDAIGKVMSYYYTRKDELMNSVTRGRPI